MENQQLTNNNVSQALEDQSIFVLLGVMDGSEAERDDFLERLQKSIWDDFLDNDIELLLTDEEIKPLVDIISRTDIDEDAKQEQMVAYLEKLIPDLEDILMEKALKLKEDLVRERLNSLEQVVEGREDKLTQLREVRAMMDGGRWADAGTALNNFTL